MRITAIALPLVLALSLAGCGGGNSAGPTPTQGDQGDVIGTSAAPPAPVRLQWGQPGEVTGSGGSKIRLTPVGVLYSKGPYPKLLDGTTNGAPENGWFVAVAIRAAPTTQADGPDESLTGSGFMWQGAEQKVTPDGGNTGGSPWVGTVNEFGNVPIQPGESEVGVLTFDVPAKGGRLLYVDPVDQSITSWDLPADAQGTGLDKVKARIRKFT